MKTIYVATAIDKNYVQHVGVMLCSLFKNNPQNKFYIYLFYNNGIEKASLVLLRTLVEHYNHSLETTKIDDNSTKHFKVSGHITVASYFRLFIPAFASERLNKIIYLDADIVVNGSIASLWNTDIQAYSVGAVENVTAVRKAVLQHTDEHCYFNAGVLLINLDKWRKEEVMQKALEFIHRNPAQIEFHDQDVLNAILYGRWLPLHPKYNMQGALFMDEFKSFRGNPTELQEAIRNPVIIHYSTPQKPWHYLSFHPYTKEYYKYLAFTPWKNYRPSDKNWVRVVRKAVRPYLKKIGITKVLGKHLY